MKSAILALTLFTLLAGSIGGLAAIGRYMPMDCTRHEEYIGTTSVTPGWAYRMRCEGKTFWETLDTTVVGKLLPHY